jgi:YggT family protein
MLAQALIFVIITIGGLFTLALLLRFVLQVMRAPARHQLAAFLAAVTDFAVRPARRIIPGLWGMDLATLMLAWLTQLLQIWLVLAARGYEPGPEVGVALIAMAALAVVQIVKFMIYIAMVAIVMQAVLSWVNPYTPIAPLLNSVTRPLLRPFQRFIPPIANVDLSPLAALFAFQLLLILPLAWLETTLTRLL